MFAQFMLLARRNAEACSGCHIWPLLASCRCHFMQQATEGITRAMEEL